MRNAEASFPTTFSPRPRKKSTIDVRGGHVYRLPNAVYRSSFSSTNQYLHTKTKAERDALRFLCVYCRYLLASKMLWMAARILYHHFMNFCQKVRLSSMTVLIEVLLKEPSACASSLSS